MIVSYLTNYNAQYEYSGTQKVQEKERYLNHTHGTMCIEAHIHTHKKLMEMEI